MKKILFLLSLLTLSAILILGCKDPNNPNPNNQTQKNQTNDDDDNLEQRLVVLQGEYKPANIDKPNYTYSPYEPNIRIKNHLIIEDNEEAEIKTIKLMKNEEHGIFTYNPGLLTIIEENNYPPETLCFSYYPWSNSVCLLTKEDNYLLYTCITGDYNTWYKYYEKITTGSSSGETVTLEGQYKIDQANNSTINFNNGNWTFSYNGQTKNGTYSQSGNELTMTFSQNGISATGVFTVTKNGDTITLTGKSGDCVTIISSAFMINDYNALQNQTVTLTVN